MRYALAVVLLAFALPHAAKGSKFELTSPEVKQGKPLDLKQVANIFGCSGGNTAPALEWKNVPAGTKSLALTVYDPDAPSGSGWWHWQVYDIPTSATGLPAGAGEKEGLPEGAQQGRNDCGVRDYCGACPPQGDKPHHYVFTLFALKVEKLDVPEDASAAMIGFMLNGNAIGKAKLTAVYSRK